MIALLEKANGFLLKEIFVLFVKGKVIGKLSDVETTAPLGQTLPSSTAWIAGKSCRVVNCSGRRMKAMLSLLLSACAVLRPLLLFRICPTKGLGTHGLTSQYARFEIALDLYNSRICCLSLWLVAGALA